MSWENEFWKSLNSIDDDKRRQLLEYERLAAGTIGRRSPEIGERVLVNAGLVQSGHVWERHEGIVLQVSDNAALVRYRDSLLRREKEAWVPFPVITDLLGKP